MRRLAFAAPMVLAACAATQPPVHGQTPGHRCDAAGTDQFIGRQASGAAGAAIMAATHAAVLRWAPPGAMLTMDYREDRVTVRTGRGGRITAVACG
jgi:Peptidase inhibitor I78 family